MAGAVSIEVGYDDVGVRDAMTRLAEFPGSRLVNYLRAIGGKMVTATKLRFDAQHAPDGAPWKPSLRAIRTGGKTLIEHGYLLGSIIANVLGGNQGVEWGSALAYAAAMQGGAQIHVNARSQSIYRKAGRDGLSARFVKKSKSNFAQHVDIGEHDITIAARPYLGLNDDDAREIEDSGALHLQAAILGTTPGAL